MATRRVWGFVIVTVTAALLASACQPGAAAPRAGGPPGAPRAAAPQPAAPQPRGPQAAPQEDPVLQATDEAWEQVVTAAKREGQLLLITNPGHRQWVEHATPVFEQEYGIQIEVVYMNGRQAEERLMAEFGAGRIQTDVAVGGDSNFYTLATNGILESFTVPNTAAISERLRSAIGPGDTYYPQMLNVYALLVNTQTIPAERVPQRWADLIDPYYKGKMVLHNPGTTGGGNSWFSSAYGVLGRAYMEKLAQQDLLIVQDPAGVESVVARGERGLGVPGGGRALITQHGAPLRWIVPEEGVAFSIQMLAIPKNAPHPNAARVWVNFALSKPAQEWWNKYGHYTPVREDVELERPEFHLANLPTLGAGYRPPQEAQRWLREGRAIFSP